MTIATNNVASARDRTMKREQNHCDEGDSEQHRSLLSNGPALTLDSRSWRRNRAVEVIGEQDRRRAERPRSAHCSTRRARGLSLICALACLAGAQGWGQQMAAAASGSSGSSGSSTLGFAKVTSTSSVSPQQGVHVEKSAAVKTPPPAKSTSTTTTTTTTTTIPTTSVITKAAKSTTTSTSTATSPPAASPSRGMTTGFYQADIEGGPASADCAPTTLPTVKKDPKLDKVFQTQKGPGWLGGDATYSTALPDGSEDFVFGDTLLGNAATNGRITSFKGIVHDSELVGTLPDLQPDFGDPQGAPSAVIPDSNADDGWQIGGGS